MYKLKLSKISQDRICEYVDRWGGSDSGSLRHVIFKKLCLLAEDPTIGRFDDYPRPIYRFQVTSVADGGFPVPLQVAYHVSDDEGAVLILDFRVVPL